MLNKRRSLRETCEGDNSQIPRISQSVCTVNKGHETRMLTIFGHSYLLWCGRTKGVKSAKCKMLPRNSVKRKFIMAENQANGSMFCQATGLPQSVADCASVPLADGHQNLIQSTETGRKFKKNTLEELRRKRLKRNKARRDKMRQMMKKERCSFIKFKTVKDLEAAHQKEITELKSSGLIHERKPRSSGRSGRRTNFSVSLKEIVPGSYKLNFS